MTEKELEQLHQELTRFPIKDLSRWSVYLYPHQYYLGRTFLLSKREGLVDLMNTNEEERKELFEAGTGVRNAVARLFQPDLFNWASLGNLINQCHVHVIPRYKESREFEGLTFTDERWGKNHAPYNKEFSVPEETLQKIASRIKEELG